MQAFFQFVFFPVLFTFQEQSYPHVPVYTNNSFKKFSVFAARFMKKEKKIWNFCKPRFFFLLLCFPKKNPFYTFIYLCKKKKKKKKKQTQNFHTNTVDYRSKNVPFLLFKKKNNIVSHKNAKTIAKRTHACGDSKI